MSSGPSQRIVGMVGVVTIILVVAVAAMGAAADFFGTGQGQAESNLRLPASNSAGTIVLTAGQTISQPPLQQNGDDQRDENLEFRDAPTPGDVQEGFFIDNDSNVTQRYIDSATGREYFVYTPADPSTSSDNQAGTACEEAANCTLLTDPGNAGTTDLDSDLTNITFVAGEEVFDVAIPSAGEANCNAGYCVTNNGDDTMSWSSDEAAADITSMELWAGTQQEAPTQAPSDTSGDVLVQSLSFCHIASPDEDPSETMIHENAALDALAAHFGSDGVPVQGHELDFLIEPIPDGLAAYPGGTPDQCIGDIPALNVEGRCLSNGGVTFAVRNNGPDMLEPQSYLIIDGDANELKAGTFSVKAGQLTTIALVGSGQGLIYGFTTSGSAGSASVTHDCTAGPTPDLVVQSMCQDGESLFIIANNGDTMTEPQSYSISGPDAVLLEGEFELGADDTITIPLTDGLVNVPYTLSSDGAAGTLDAVTICEAPAVVIESQCQDGVAEFLLTNEGSAMTESQTYSITGPDDFLLEGDFNLSAGESVTIPVADGLGNVSYAFSSDGAAGTLEANHLCEVSAVEIEPQCDNGMAIFALTNIGAAMTESQAYAISGPDGFLLEGEFNLGAGETLAIPVMGGEANVTYIFSSDGAAGTFEMSHFCEAPAVVMVPLCDEDVPAFVLTNEGSAMPGPEAYTISGPDGLLLEDEFNLGAGESVTIPVTDGQRNVSYTFTSDNLEMDTICEAPEVVVEPLCQSGTAAFALTNSGADMDDAQDYAVSGPDGFLLEGQLQLSAGETVVIPIAGGHSGGRYVFNSDGAAGSFQTNTSCATISVDHVCGFVNLTLGDDPGFPVVNMDNQNCAPDVEQAHPNWISVVTGDQNVCPDWLLYHTNQTGDWEIFRLGELAGRPQADPNISRGVGPSVFDIAPSRSPDAEWITFTSTRDRNWEIYVAAVDGSFQQRVTINDQAIDLDPVWSPDGTRIVYESNVTTNWELWVVDLATGEKSRLTDDPASDINAYWSPDSSKIVFQSDRDGGLWQIYELDIATGSVTRLSDGKGDDYDPVYANNGAQIAFRSVRNGGQSTIYTMNADGTGLTQISDSGGSASNHVWSSDDDLIAYQSDSAGGVNDIYVHQVSTGLTRLITENQEPYAIVEDTAPTWFCDSSTLAFTSTITGDSNIYSYPALPMDANPIPVDVSASQLTDNPGGDRDPSNTPSEENASRGGALPASQ